MATLKVKNSNGEWVNAPLKALLGEFVSVLIPRGEDGMSYDLSSYVASGDEFILFFYAGSGTNGSIYTWNSADEKLTQMKNAGNLDSADNYNDYFIAPYTITDIKATFDAETKVVKTNKYQVGLKALLFYIK